MRFFSKETKNFKEIKKRAEKGNVDEQYNLAVLYEAGVETSKNEELAYKWFLKSAEQDHPLGKLQAVIAYLTGMGTEKDISKAEQLIEEIQSKKLLPDEASNTIAKLQSTVAEFYFDGEEIAKDDKKAFDLFVKASQFGETKAEYYLGFFYFEGIVVSKNIETASFWLEKAANKDHTLAKYYLACVYDEKAEYSKAIEYYTEAALEGCIYAQTKLCTHYIEGKEITKDIEKGAFWLEKLAEQGVYSAQELLGKWYYEGELLPKDIEKGAFWLEKAAEQGSAEAQNLLAVLYFNENKKDTDVILDLLRRSAEQGNTDAEGNLEFLYKKMFGNESKDTGVRIEYNMSRNENKKQRKANDDEFYIYHTLHGK